MSFSSHAEFHIAFFAYYHSKKYQKVYQYLTKNKFQALCQAIRFVEIFGGSNLITRTFLAKFREFCLHCLYIADFVCNVRMSQ